MFYQLFSTGLIQNIGGGAAGLVRFYRVSTQYSKRFICPKMREISFSKPSTSTISQISHAVRTSKNEVSLNLTQKDFDYIRMALPDREGEGVPEVSVRYNEEGFPCNFKVQDSSIELGGFSSEVIRADLTPTGVLWSMKNEYLIDGLSSSLQNLISNPLDMIVSSAFSADKTIEAAVAEIEEGLTLLKMRESVTLLSKNQVPDISLFRDSSPRKAVVISPSNFPFSLGLWPMYEQLLMGREVVMLIPPSSFLGWSNVEFNLQLPYGSLVVLPSFPQIVSEVIKHDSVASVTFTGSTDDYRILMRQLIQNQSKAVMMGENNGINRVNVPVFSQKILKSILLDPQKYRPLFESIYTSFSANKGRLSSSMSELVLHSDNQQLLSIIESFSMGGGYHFKEKFVVNEGGGRETRYNPFYLNLTTEEPGMCRADALTGLVLVKSVFDVKDACRDMLLKGPANGYVGRILNAPSFPSTGEKMPENMFSGAGLSKSVAGPHPGVGTTLGCLSHLKYEGEEHLYEKRVLSEQFDYVVGEVLFSEEIRHIVKKISFGLDETIHFFDSGNYDGRVTGIFTATKDQFHVIACHDDLVRAVVLSLAVRESKYKGKFNFFFHSNAFLDMTLVERFRDIDVQDSVFFEFSKWSDLKTKLSDYDQPIQLYTCSYKEIENYVKLDLLGAVYDLDFKSSDLIQYLMALLREQSITVSIYPEEADSVSEMLFELGNEVFLN